MKLSLSWLARHRPYFPAIASGLLLGISSAIPALGGLAFLALIPAFAIAAELPGRVFEDKTVLPFKALIFIAFRLLTLQFIWRRKRKIFVYERRLIPASTQLFRYSFVTMLLWQSIAMIPFTLPSLRNIDEPAGLLTLAALSAIVVVNAFLYTIPQQVCLRLLKLTGESASMIILPVTWTAFEFVYMQWFLAWPWSTIGFMPTGYPRLLSFAATTGPSGIVFLVVLLNILLYQSMKAGNILWFRVVNIGIFVVVFVAFLFPLTDKKSMDAPGGESNPVKIRLIQPNFHADGSGAEMTRMEKMELLHNLLTRQPWDSTGIVILPENVFPKPMTKEDLLSEDLLEGIRLIALGSDVSIIAGFTEIGSGENGGDLPAIAGNEPRVSEPKKMISAALFQKDGMTAIYRKQHFVPLVERLPFPGFISFFKNALGQEGLMKNQYSFAGPEGDWRDQYRNHIHMYIGFEAAFPAAVRDGELESQGINVVVSTDSRILDSWQMEFLNRSSSFLSVVTGRPTVHVSNRGVSAFCDSAGISRKQTTRGMEDVLDLEVEPAGQASRFIVHGEMLGFASFFLVLAGLIIVFFSFLFRK